MHAAHDASGSPLSVGAARRRFALLALGSMGVVFGDIGTSPLYAFQGAVTAAAHGAVGQGEIFGITSLIIWALLIVVTAKYVFFIMRADNHGEGGILSLMALAQNALGRRTAIVLGLGVIGAAMFYGDAIITPAISVLSAVEGLETVPSLAHAITPAVEISSSLFLLIVLFMVQSRGTAKVAAWFGPICVVWFVSIAALGVMQIPREPRILLAFLPTYAVGFLVHHGFVGMLVLGAVSLTITGGGGALRRHGSFRRAADPRRLAGGRLPGPADQLPRPGRIRPALSGRPGEPRGRSDVAELVLSDGARGVAHSDGRPGDGGDHHSQPGGDQRRLFDDQFGDADGTSAQAARAAHLGDRGGPDLHAHGQHDADGRRHLPGRHLQERGGPCRTRTAWPSPGPCP